MSDVLWLATHTLEAYVHSRYYWPDIYRYGLPIKIEADYWFINLPNETVHYDMRAWNGKKRS